jgi:tRNA(Ser,Leu) C12 N-acetylase TAN1
MHDWNVVVSVHGTGFIRACELLQGLGRLDRTSFLNLLVMRVDDVRQAIESLRQWISEDPTITTVVARVMPVNYTFGFQTVEEFQEKACQAALSWASALAGKAFYVRMHRRGFKGQLSSQTEERRLSEAILEALDKAGTPGRVTFQDPDAVLAVETVGNQAGLSLWSRDELERYPFLKVG